MKHRVKGIDGWSANEVVEILKKLLRTSDYWQFISVTMLHSRQTREERVSKATIEKNHVGWSASDALIMSVIHREITKNGVCQLKHIKYLDRALPKYASQLLTYTDFPLDKFKEVLKTTSFDWDINGTPSIRFPKPVKIAAPTYRKRKFLIDTTTKKATAGEEHPALFT